MRNLGNEDGDVLCALEGVELERMVRLEGDERYEPVVVGNVHSNVALGTLVLKCADGFACGGIPLNDHGVLAFVSGDNESFVLRDRRTCDDVHVTLQVDVLLADMVIYDSCVRRGLEQVSRLFGREVVH